MSTQARKETQFSGLLKVGSQGEAVKRVQEWLCLHGFTTGIDGDYGSKTHASVVAFQSRKGLVADGCVGDGTFGLLCEPMREALAIPSSVVPLPGASALGSAVVGLALQHLKQRPREVGGPNMGPWVRLYMGGNEGAPWAWCAGFVTFLVQQTGLNTQGVSRTFSCDTLAAQAQKAGRFLAQPSTLAQAKVTPGSIFLVRSKPNDWTHTGIVVRVEGDQVHTIEGNTNEAGSREGTSVLSRVRTFGNLDFFLL